MYHVSLSKGSCGSDRKVVTEVLAECNLVPRPFGNKGRQNIAIAEYGRILVEYGRVWQSMCGMAEYGRVWQGHGMAGLMLLAMLQAVTSSI